MTPFIRDTIERAIKTFAQSLLATLAIGVPIWDLAWTESLGLAASATVISLLTSLASSQIGNRNTAAALSYPADPTAGRHTVGE